MSLAKKLQLNLSNLGWSLADVNGTIYPSECNECTCLFYSISNSPETFRSLVALYVHVKHSNGYIIRQKIPLVCISQHSPNLIHLISDLDNNQRILLFYDISSISGLKSMQNYFHLKRSSGTFHYGITAVLLQWKVPEFHF